MRLKIRNLTKNDFGMFKCVAKNSLGETDGNIKLYGKPFSHSTTITLSSAAKLFRKSGARVQCEKNCRLL